MRTRITISDGDIISGRHDVRDIVRNCKDGDYSLSIEKWTRSLAQNATLWMWIEDLRKHHGYTKQEMYDALIEAYSWIYTYKDLQGKPKQKKVTTSMMNVEEMQHFMDSVIQHAAEENVTLRIPDDT